MCKLSQGTGVPDYVGGIRFKTVMSSETAGAVIRAASDPNVTAELGRQGLRINWKAIGDAIHEGLIEEMPKVVHPSRFDIDKAAPILRDAPKPIQEIRNEVNELIRANADGTLIAGWGSRVLGILEQIVMTLENVSFATTQLSTKPYTIYPTITPPPFAPSLRPFLGDVPFPGGSTVCSSKTSDLTGFGPINQADGHSDDLPF